MGLDLIPAALRTKFRFDEREHATAILATDFKKQFQDILDCMSAFTLKKSYFAVAGGARSPIPEVIDGFLQGAAPAQQKTVRANAASKKPKRAPTAPIGPAAGRGWKEKKFDIEIRVDGGSVPIPTHKIDNFLQMPGDARGVGRVEREAQRGVGDLGRAGADDVLRRDERAGAVGAAEVADDDVVEALGAAAILPAVQRELVEIELLAEGDGHGFAGRGGVGVDAGAAAAA